MLSLVVASVLAAILFFVLVSASLNVLRQVRGTRASRLSRRPARRPKRAPERPFEPPTRLRRLSPEEADLAARVEEVFRHQGEEPPVEEPPDEEAPGQEAPGEEPPGQDPLGEARVAERPGPEVPGNSVAAVPEEAAPERQAPRMAERLSKARALLSGHLAGIRRSPKIDEQTWSELEDALILADVGPARAGALLDELRRRTKAGEIRTPAGLMEALKTDMKALLSAGERTLDTGAGSGTVTVWLFVGVNGVGKTTTIGKIGLREAAAGHSIVMAAGDTFRAAASEQLELWARRVGADLVRGEEGADPAAVVFDAVKRAASRGCDLVLADTAGRLHTKKNLMEELKKVRRVAEREPGQVREVLLVIDATTGQNGLAQAREFAEAVGVTGVVLTKLDGTAKGGIVLAIQGDLGLTVKLVGLGEGPQDLVEFDPDEFVDALFE